MRNLARQMRHERNCEMRANTLTVFWWHKRRRIVRVTYDILYRARKDPAVCSTWAYLIGMPNLKSLCLLPRCIPDTRQNVLLPFGGCTSSFTYTGIPSFVQIGYFWISFDRLLGGNFHANLATPLTQLAIAAGCNPGGPVTVTMGSRMPIHGPWPIPGCHATLQIDFIMRQLSVRGRYRNSLK